MVRGNFYGLGLLHIMAPAYIKHTRVLDKSFLRITI